MTAVHATFSLPCSSEYGVCRLSLFFRMLKAGFLSVWFFSPFPILFPPYPRSFYLFIFRACLDHFPPLLMFMVSRRFLLLFLSPREKRFGRQGSTLQVQ